MNLSFLSDSRFSHSKFLAQLTPVPNPSLLNLTFSFSLSRVLREAVSLGSTLGITGNH